MKVPITDKFLWDVYKFLYATGEVVRFATREPTMRNFLPGPKNPIWKKYRKDKSERQFGNFIYYLKRKGYIKVKSLEGKEALVLTKNGIEKAMKASFALGEAQKRKDGKWIMLIFDMPVNHKNARGLMRSILKNLGFKMFQQSVWITPYDVSEKTENLLQVHSLDKYVKIFIIEEL